MAATFLPSPPDISSFTAGCCPARIPTTSSSIKKRSVVCSSSTTTVKDLETLLYHQFSAQLNLNNSTSLSASSTTKVDKEEERKRNYYLNTGYAIRILREEFPTLFYKDLNFDIYRDDIVFKDPLNTFTGIENYKSIFWALRFHGRMFFRVLWIDIVSVWQPVEGVLMIRWTVHGIPRVPWESRGRFDGTSEYKLDKDGKIYEHRVHNIALNGPPKFRVIAVQELIEYIGCPSTPKPTFFKISDSSLGNIMPVEFADLRHHLGSILSSVKRDEEHSQHT